MHAKCNEMKNGGQHHNNVIFKNLYSDFFGKIKQQNKGRK